MSAMSADSVEEAMVAGVNSEVKEKDAIDKRYEKICEAMETLSKSLTTMSAKNSATVSAPQQARPPPTCYNCQCQIGCRTDDSDKRGSKEGKSCGAGKKDDENRGGERKGWSLASCE